MESVLRAGTMFVVLLLLFRVTGRRTLGETNTFDFVLLLIISEATQQAMLGDDPSMTNAVLVTATLLLCNILLSLLKRRLDLAAKVLEGVPTLIVAHGRPLRDRLHQARLDDEDVLSAARQLQGLERMEQIRFAVLETSGKISIVPWQDAPPTPVPPVRVGKAGQ